MDGLAVGVGFDAHIEGHDDVRAYPLLGLDGGFGGEFVERAVNVGLEEDAVVVNLAEVFEAEALEASAVGEDGAVPAHEGVKAAELFQQVGSGAEEEVVGVG